MTENLSIQALTAKIVVSYAGNNPVEIAEVGALISTVYRTLVDLQSGAAPTEESQKLVPAVPVRKSITPDAVYCLDCGSPQKMLKRHLQSAHGLSIDEYRAKWNLPSDYPMVAPNYAAARSEMAKKIGLGKSRAVRGMDAAPKTKPEKGHRYPASRWSKPSE